MANTETGKRKAVYTAITGNYDLLKKPSCVNRDWDYICFTDNRNQQSDFWKIIYIDDPSLDLTRKNRRYKILPHKFLPEYDCSLYVDGNFDIVGDIDDYINTYKKRHSMLCFMHPDRDCIYDESIACINFAKDSEKVIIRQMSKYRAEGYPEHRGLLAGGILYREHHDKKLQKVMEDWWHELETKSRRDQLSFNYVCWKNQFEYDRCDLPYGENKYFRIGFHNAIDTKLYWGKSEFSEARAVQKTVALTDGNFTVRFDLKDCKQIRQARRLRFDPATQPTRLRSIKIAMNFKDRSSKVLNIKSTNPTLTQTNEHNAEELVFHHNDPIIEIGFDAGDMRRAESIEVSGNLELLEDK